MLNFGGRRQFPSGQTAFSMGLDVLIANRWLAQQRQLPLKFQRLISRENPVGHSEGMISRSPFVRQYEISPARARLCAAKVDEE